MFQSTCIGAFVVLICAAHSLANITTEENETSLINFKASTLFLFKKPNKNKPTIIVENTTDVEDDIHNSSELSRRQRSRKKKNKVVKTILYQEYDDDGNVVNTFLMRTLADVVAFFKAFLETEIVVCYNECGPEVKLPTKKSTTPEDRAETEKPIGRSGINRKGKRLRKGGRKKKLDEKKINAGVQAT